MKFFVYEATVSGKLKLSNGEEIPTEIGYKTRVVLSEKNPKRALQSIRSAHSQCVIGPVTLNQAESERLNNLGKKCTPFK